MSNKYSELAMVDIVEALIKENNKPITIQEIFSKVAEIKGFELDDVDTLTKLYMNIVESGKFVFMGEDKWDLKEGNLDLWSDDGSAFIETVSNIKDDGEFSKFDASDFEDDIEEEDDVAEDIIDDFEEDEDDELDEETKKELEEEKEYIEVELPLHTSDDDDDIEFDADSFDEEDYDDIMDDYEDMYED